jgi:hypothetical protein
MLGSLLFFPRRRAALIDSATFRWGDSCKVVTTGYIDKSGSSTTIDLVAPTEPLAKKEQSRRCALGTTWARKNVTSKECGEFNTKRIL